MRTVVGLESVGCFSEDPEPLVVDDRAGGAAGEAEAARHDGEPAEERATGDGYRVTSASVLRD